jgi:selenobiotic family peptide radical SAM maturase
MLEDPQLKRKASHFTIQWHLTHACDLACRHCYDRTKLSVLRLPQAFAVLNDLESFCAEHEVKPSVCLSGGNPFFYAWFFELYQEVADRGLPVSILGNPVEREMLDRMCEIKKPRYFQVSLEGLQAHNDYIRGEGFFDRVLAFLDLLKEYEIRSVVMTTLTEGNVDEVVPLAKLLQGRADRFSFNRLSQVGNGKDLGAPSKERYGHFMVEWLRARRENRTLGLKDNLFNIFHHELGMKLNGGCTGYGCGAAFNFVAILPDGSVHACRKFPSPIGNIRLQSLREIYGSPEAQKYRRGCSACDECSIRHRCGGCMAVTSGHEMDPFTERDPHCFMYD